jgi:hypothetical protein
MEAMNLRKVTEWSASLVHFLASQLRVRAGLRCAWVSIIGKGQRGLKLPAWIGQQACNGSVECPLEP